MSWIDYKIYAYLFLSPRYVDRIKGLVEGISDRDYYSKIKNIIEIIDKDYDKFATEFTSCFINDFKHVKCPPYESWYMEKTIYGKSAQEVLEEYLKYGIYPQKQLPDHIATEMEFVSYLFFIKEEKKANAFIINHILNWTPKLVDDIIKHSHGEYAKLIGESLKSLIESESKRISYSQQEVMQ
ncbi:TorD/DmsD family molecular chaperone [Acidianus manzaensis]|uniref:Cytoplasmic chaperone TorD family protein n=1 Tax=Acidianus manzaensis TaxID=282676 RepID=A0A1W6JYI8_9CREN|nr:molecular chaperone TorD family protein [Acidianus manzaensis]ARM75328.1 hypothetical protein B6F84_04295 [Acidianus manzaensis]